MKGNFHVQFLGEGVAATSPPYPTLGWATTQVYPARISTSLSDNLSKKLDANPACLNKPQELLAMLSLPNPKSTATRGKAKNTG